MGKSPQRGFEPSYDQGHAGKCLSCKIAVDDGRSVGPESRLASGGIVVLAPFLLRAGVVSDHGVYVSAGNHRAEPGLSHDLEGFCRSPVRLGQYSYPEARMFQQTSQKGCGKGRMVHIGIGGDEKDIKLIPASLLHVGF